MSEISSHVLRDGDAEITVLSIGCAVQSWRVGGRPVVLGYLDPESYRANPASMGIVVGRVANRISGSQFELGGQVWDLPSKEGGVHIHGGPRGIGWQNWEMDPIGAREVVLRLHSPHLDQGYPGAVDFTVRMSLAGAALTWDMRAVPDRETPINLAQHLYFNLSGRGSVQDHGVALAADHFTENGTDLIPNGKILPVGGTRFDFRRGRILGDIDPMALGYDLNFVLQSLDGPQAQVWSPDGMRLRLWTDQPGLQIYTSGSLAPFGKAVPAGTHRSYGALCLEAQGFPNAVNLPEFDTNLASPDKPYVQRTTIEIARAPDGGDQGRRG